MLLALLTIVILLATISSAAAIPRPQHELRTTSNASDLHNIHSTQLPTGAILNQCMVPGTVALTFDDGPYIYTAQMLDTLSAHGAVATFFLNGVNKGSIDAFPHLIYRALNEGHQIGSHSYVHPQPKTKSEPANSFRLDGAISPCPHFLMLESSSK